MQFASQVDLMSTSNAPSHPYSFLSTAICTSYEHDPSNGHANQRIANLTNHRSRLYALNAGETHAWVSVSAHTDAMLKQMQYGILQQNEALLYSHLSSAPMLLVIIMPVTPASVIIPISTFAGPIPLTSVIILMPLAAVSMPM